MAEETTMKIADWIKMNSNISKIANDLGKSRPSMYKYIEYYDTGQMDLVPDDVRAFFDEKLSEEDGSTIDRIKEDLKEEISLLEKRIEQTTCELKKYMDELNSIQAQIKIQKESGSDDSKGAIELKMRFQELQARVDMTSVVLDHAKTEMDARQRKLAQYESVKVPILEAKGVFKIKSRCYFENGKCMVFHTGPVYEDRFYYLHLYIKIDNEYSKVGTYTPVKDRNFFIIDDVFFSAPLYYDVTGYDVDYRYESTEDGVPLTTSPELTTGMCELKQRK